MKPPATRNRDGTGLHVETRAYIDAVPTAYRKSLGQYFTPEALREELIRQVPLRAGLRVLDPGVGTGEFLASLDRTGVPLDLHGWDVDAGVLEVARRVVPGARLEERDALASYDGERFDLVIGNPPYYEVRGRPELRDRFRDVIGGRPNIFAMFFQVGLSVLRDGGHLAFVVPPSMNNGAYFDRLRSTITSHAAVRYLKVIPNGRLFAGAQQAVQLLVLEKGARSEAHLFRRTIGSPGLFGRPHERVVFCEDPAELEGQFAGRRTLFDLGYRAVTGRCVWNQNRSNLRREPEPEACPLIWAHNIAGDRLELLEDHRRPQYVVGQRPLTGPAIVVNRITGTVGTGELRAAAVPKGMEFVGENHVNVVVRRENAKPLVPWRRLLTALRAPGVTERVRRLTGNTQISATELTHLLPLDA